jgi:hypothetical protein
MYVVLHSRPIPWSSENQSGADLLQMLVKWSTSTENPTGYILISHGLCHNDMYVDMWLQIHMSVSDTAEESLQCTYVSLPAHRIRFRA